MIRPQIGSTSLLLAVQCYYLQKNSMLLSQDRHYFCSHFGVYEEQALSNMESTFITGLCVAAGISKRVNSVKEIP